MLRPLCTRVSPRRSPSRWYSARLYDSGVRELFTLHGLEGDAAIGAAITLTFSPLLGGPELGVAPDLAAAGPMAGGLTIADISGEGFTPAELNAASYLYKQGGNYVVLRTAVGTRAGGGTSDLLVNGTRWDVYTPEADTSVRNIMSTAAGKWTQVHGGGVFIDLSNTGLSAVDMGNALARINGFINSWGGTPVSGVRFYGG